MLKALITSLLVIKATRVVGIFTIIKLASPYVDKKYLLNSISYTDLVLYGTLVAGLITTIASFFARVQFYEYTLYIGSCVTIVQIIDAIVSVLKLFIARKRPCFENWPSTSGHQHFESFPSGHTATATSLAVYIVFMANKLIKSQIVRFTLVIMAIIFAIINGRARFYDNKHFVSDIFAGGIVGVIITYFYLKKTIE